MSRQLAKKENFILFRLRQTLKDVQVTMALLVTKKICLIWVTTYDRKELVMRKTTAWS